MVGSWHVSAATSRPGRPVPRRAEEAGGSAFGRSDSAARGEPATARGERSAEGSAEETEAGAGRHGQGNGTG